MQLPDKSQLKKKYLYEAKYPIINKFTPKQKIFSETLGKASNQSKEKNDA